MSVFEKVIIGIFLVSFTGGSLLSYWGLEAVAKTAGTPALLLSGWVSFGHFITLDDDMPGEWANPEGSKKLWYGSLAILLGKIAVFVAVIYLIYL